MSVVTAIEVQKRNKERANVYLDGEYAFSLNIMEAAQLRKGQNLSEQEVQTLKDADAVEQTVERALRFLSYRPRSVAEVRRNLLGKDIAESVVEAAIEKLLNFGYLDDHAFAKFWIESRQREKPMGARGLRYELRKKGVADSIINTMLTDLNEDDSAYNAASSRVRRLRGTDRQTFKKKLGGYLQRRGFSYGTASDAIRRLIDELEETEPDYFADNADDDHLF